MVPRHKEVHWELPPGCAPPLQSQSFTPRGSSLVVGNTEVRDHVIHRQLRLRPPRRERFLQLGQRLQRVPIGSELRDDRSMTLSPSAHGWRPQSHSPVPLRFRAAPWRGLPSGRDSPQGPAWRGRFSSQTRTPRGGP